MVMILDSVMYKTVNKRTPHIRAEDLSSSQCPRVTAPNISLKYEKEVPKIISNIIKRLECGIGRKEVGKKV